MGASPKGSLHRTLPNEERGSKLTGVWEQPGKKGVFLKGKGEDEIVNILFKQDQGYLLRRSRGKGEGFDDITTLTERKAGSGTIYFAGRSDDGTEYALFLN